VPLAHHQMTELVVLSSCSGKKWSGEIFLFCSCKDPKVVYFKWASPASKQHFLDWLVKVSRSLFYTGFGLKTSLPNGPNPLQGALCHSLMSVH
jgi:hypothetical protein